ncbi:MAG: hypothetical protein NTZ83_03320 [Candidatus Pacearchaeota archaeon]|nr:hypothetical protein [Candidatus Pacearchaeota archaeon]
MEFKYKIENPTHELIVDAFKNPPESPDRINLTFLADGIKIPYFTSRDPKNGELINYLIMCKDHKIIPFSEKTIKYDFDVKEKIPTQPESLENFFGGGRTNSVLIDINRYNYQGIIEKFNEILFPSLLKNNYKISGGQITFSEHKVGDHYSEGYEPDLGIFLNRGCNGLGFLLDNYYVKKNIEKYEKWFVQLSTLF